MINILYHVQNILYVSTVYIYINSINFKKKYTLEDI